MEKASDFRYTKCIKSICALGVPMIRQLVLFFYSLCVPVLLQAAVLLKSRDNLLNTSFSFAVEQHAYDVLGRHLFVAARENITEPADKQFALSMVGPFDQKFVGLTPETVILNGEEKVTNPLFGAGIKLLALMGEKDIKAQTGPTTATIHVRPVVVKQDNPAALYIFDALRRSDNMCLFEINDIHDAQGLTTNGIIALAATEFFAIGAAQQEKGERAVTQSFVVAAVQKNKGEFGVPGAGLALIRFTRKVTQDNKNKTVIDRVNAQLGEHDGNKAVPLDPETPALFINKPVTEINNTATLYWNSYLSTLYIGLQLKASENSTSGARAVVAGIITEGGVLSLRSIAPDAAFSSTKNIVGERGGTGDAARTIINKISSMHTSTYLDYLIVQGGNGTIDHDRKLFALPLVNDPTSPALGQLAKKNQKPRNNFNQDGRFISRVLAEPAEQAGDLFTEQDNAAFIGGSLTPGRVRDIFVNGDTVFASIEDSQEQQGGIWYSQAIFNKEGLIAQWSPWRRAGAVGSIFGFALDGHSGDFSFLTGPTINTIKTVERTVSGLVPSSGLIAQEFPQEQGGVQGIIDVPFNTQGLSKTVGDRLSLQIFTGLSKLVLLQTGADNNNSQFGPINPGLSSPIFSTINGGFAGFKPGVFALSLSGGTLAELGPLVTAAFFVDNIGNGYIVVGGTNGVAVLARQNGTGFDAFEGLKSGFAGLSADMRFIKISDHSNVRKLIVDDTELYVLTDKSLDRLIFSPEAIAKKSVPAESIATAIGVAGPQETFSDAIIIEGIGILATSKGLYSSASSVNLGRISKEGEAGWQMIALNETVGAMTQLFLVPSAQGLAQKSQLYVLNASVSMQQARIYRLFIDKANTNNSVQPLNDFFVRNLPTFFLSIGNYRNYIATDGTLVYLSRSKYIQQPVIFELLFPELLVSTVKRNAHSKGTLIDLAASGASAIGPIIRSSSSGAWLVVGDFGIRGNT